MESCRQADVRFWLDLMILRSSPGKELCDAVGAQESYHAGAAWGDAPGWLGWRRVSWGRARCWLGSPPWRNQASWSQKDGGTQSPALLVNKDLCGFSQESFKLCWWTLMASLQTSELAPVHQTGLIYVSLGNKTVLAAFWTDSWLA